MFDRFDHLEHYTNERSLLLQRLRNGVEEGWQAWERAQLGEGLVHGLQQVSGSLGVGWVDVLVCCSCGGWPLRQGYVGEQDALPVAHTSSGCAPYLLP